MSQLAAQLWYAAVARAVRLLLACDDVLLVELRRGVLTIVHAQNPGQIRAGLGRIAAALERRSPQP